MCALPLGVDSIQSDEAMREVMRVLIEDVTGAINDVVELIKLFKSKNKISRVLQSTLFRRRQDELDVIVHRAESRLQVSGVVFLAGRSSANMYKRRVRTL